jgi:chromate transporter
MGLKGSFDWISALITVTAAVALFKYKRNVIHVIAASALIGLAIKSLTF